MFNLITTAQQIIQFLSHGNYFWFVRTYRNLNELKTNRSFVSLDGALDGPHYQRGKSFSAQLQSQVYE